MVQEKEKGNIRYTHNTVFTTHQHKHAYTRYAPTYSEKKIMDPSSPAKRRALAPLDANVNAISSPTKLHKHSKLGAAPQSPRKSSSSSPIKSLNLKRSFAAAAVDIFDENALVPKKKQCQEPASAAVGSDAAATTTTTAAPVAVVAPATTPAREVALASEATSPVTAIPSASRAAQTEMEMDVDPDATEVRRYLKKVN